MKTLLTIKEQEQFLSDNWNYQVLTHKWSTRGYGNSKIIDDQGSVVAKANGCGYDRFGTVVGLVIEKAFPEQLNKLAKRFCKQGKRNDTRKGSKEFYGMFYNAKTKKAHVDGGCGSRSMEHILNAIGFDLVFISETSGSNSGMQIYMIKPASKNTKKYMLKGVK